MFDSQELKIRTGDVTGVAQGERLFLISGDLTRRDVHMFLRFGPEKPVIPTHSVAVGIPSRPALSRSRSRACALLRILPICCNLAFARHSICPGSLARRILDRQSSAFDDRVRGVAQLARKAAAIFRYSAKIFT
jgi:hypothetical protein